LALYHQHAEKLKPFVKDANFSAEQLNLILKMMRNCNQLRQAKVIESFFECMLPDNMVKEYEDREGQNGKYQALIIKEGQN